MSYKRCSKFGVKIGTVFGDLLIGAS
ncbi:hypothetical protein MGSAQ_002702, partial [marine sediment metagenome]